MSYAAYDESYTTPGPRPAFYVLGVSIAIAVIAAGLTGAFIFDRIDHMAVESRAASGEYSQPMTQDSQDPPSLMAMMPTPKPIPMAIPVTPDTTGETMKAGLSDQDAQQVTDAVDADDGTQPDTATVDTTPVQAAQDVAPAPAGDQTPANNPPANDQGLN